jgi:hypothetical protein
MKDSLRENEDPQTSFLRTHFGGTGVPDDGRVKSWLFLFHESMQGWWAVLALGEIDGSGGVVVD